MFEALQITELLLIKVWPELGKGSISGAAFCAEWVWNSYERTPGDGAKIHTEQFCELLTDTRLRADRPVCSIDPVGWLFSSS